MNLQFGKIIVNARFLTQKITGVQRYAIELSKALKIKRPDILFVAPDNIIHHEIADLLDVKVVGNTTNGILWEQIELPLYLKSNGNPLLVNLGNVAPLFYGNNIVTIYDLAFYLHPEWFSKKFTLFYNFLVPRIVKKSRVIITCSFHSKDDICKYFYVNKTKVEVIYPAVSEIFLDKYLQQKDTTNSYGRYILAVSSLDPRKNFKSLIKAFKKCQFSEEKLIIVGNKDKLFASDAELNTLSKDTPNIIFTGYVNDKDLVSLYRNAYVFAYPSLFEGFGLPPLEAMACNCVTVVSNTTSLPEVCGSASIYVDPNDVDSIKEGILRVFNDEAERKLLINLGRRRVLNFNMNNSVNKMISIIDSLV